MNAAALRWHAGAPSLRTAVEAALAAPDALRVLYDNPRRRLLVLPAPAGALLIKQFRVASGRHPLRERWKARLGRGPAEREFRALCAVHAAGIPVAEPLGLAALPDGDRLLVLAFVEGHTLAEALHCAAAPRRVLLGRLGEAVAALHRAGWTHGDLHHGNVRVGRDGPLLLDLQRARRCRSARRRESDLGDLDASLWSRLGVADRVRLRAAALGVARPFSAAARARLRAVGAAAQRRAWRLGRSRTRRALRPGRRFASVRIGAARGLRLRELAPEAVAEALAAHASALIASDARVLKHDERSSITAVRVGDRAVVVKEVRPRGVGRRLADALRGSAARRAWRAGHGLHARDVGAALPLAFVEERRFGLPRRAVVVLEDLRPASDALRSGPLDPEATVDALLRVLLALHRRGVDHGDLKAAHVFLAATGDGDVDAQAGGVRRYEPRLIDLESVRFRRRLPDARRIEALAQLNASLPDAVPAVLRLRAFRRYAGVHRFAGGSGPALDAIVARSLARDHRWRGEDCRLAEAQRCRRTRSH